MDNINRIKKRTILFLTLIIPCLCIEKAISHKEVSLNTHTKVEIMYNNLKNTTQWHNLVIIWKNLTDKPEKILNQALESDVQKDLYYLKSHKLLSTKEKLALEEVIITRINHIRQKYAAVKCYNMTAIGAKLYETKEDLEHRYSIMEKLFKEGKLSDKTFKIAKNKILEDINAIENTKVKALSVHEKADLIEIITSLNE